MQETYTELSYGSEQIIARVMRTPLELARGQMLRRDIKPQLFILGKTRTLTMHTFFVKDTLDIFSLDKHMRVTEKHRVSPFNYIRATAHYILETKAGETTLRVGDTLT